MVLVCGIAVKTGVEHVQEVNGHRGGDDCISAAIQVVEEDRLPLIGGD